MQINRLFEIVYILLEKKTVTAPELANRFEVSVRTIYRDIDILSSAGIPVYASQGKGGGISLLSGYVLDKSVLSEKEQGDILFALQSFRSAYSPETDKIITRLSSLFKKEPADWLEVDLSPWGSGNEQIGQFNILKDAILAQRMIKFKYMNTVGENSEREVEPLKLLFKERAWYLNGFCLSKNEPRTFRLSRMTDIRDTGEAFQKRHSENGLQTNEEATAKKRVSLRLKITPYGAYRVYDEFAENEIVKDPDGSFIITTSLPEGEWIYNYLFSFGADMEVLSPQNVRDCMEKRIEKLRGRYKNRQ